MDNCIAIAAFAALTAMVAQSELEETIYMPRNHKSSDKQQPIELTADFLGEDRHEFVAKLAYKFWEERGRPLGSPDVDWFAAERAMHTSLLVSGLITPSPNTPQPVQAQIYR